LHIFIKMKKEFFRGIEIPEGVEINFEKKDNNLIITVKGPEGENKRIFKVFNLDLEKKDNKLIIGNKKSTKREKKMTNTLTAHINNMIKGVQKKFEYKLKVVFSHFPINVEVAGNKVIIKNFLGEKTPRECEIPEKAEVEVNKDIITIKSIDKEIAGQAAAVLERCTKIRMRDRRIFQDGIYIIEKAGKEI